MQTLFFFRALPLLLVPLALSAQDMRLRTLLPLSREEGVVENFETRERYLELILGPVAEGAAAPAAVLAQSSGLQVQFRTERQGGFLYYLFLNQEGSSFPIDGSGNWIIKREMSSGR